MSLSAFLFDLDGTLVSSDALHFKTFQSIGRQYGVEIDEDFFVRHISGHTNAEICQSMFPGMTEAEHVRIADEKEELFRSRLNEMELVPGLNDLLDWGTAQGIRMAVVSNAPMANIKAILDTFGITGKFDAVISADELERGKPDPLPYQVGLEKLGASADEAVAFEDAIPGMIAACRAGIPTVGVMTTRTADDLQKAGACLTVPDFTAQALAEYLGTRKAAA